MKVVKCLGILAGAVLLLLAACGKRQGTSASGASSEPALDPLGKVGKILADAGGDKPLPGDAVTEGESSSPLSKIPVAVAVPDKPGFVVSPYNGKWVDVTGLPSGVLVADPHFPEAEQKYFRVPEPAAESPSESVESPREEQTIL